MSECGKDHPMPAGDRRKRDELGIKIVSGALGSHASVPESSKSGARMRHNSLSMPSRLCTRSGIPPGFAGKVPSNATFSKRFEAAVGVAAESRRSEGARLVYDEFHILQHANPAVDEARKEDWTAQLRSQRLKSMEELVRMLPKRLDMAS
jgi:hypothetical protein